MFIIADAAGFILYVYFKIMEYILRGIIYIVTGIVWLLIMGIKLFFKKLPDIINGIGMIGVGAGIAIGWLIRGLTWVCRKIYSLYSRSKLHDSIMSNIAVKRINTYLQSHIIK